MNNNKKNNNNKKKLSSASETNPFFSKSRVFIYFYTVIHTTDLLLFCALITLSCHQSRQAGSCKSNCAETAVVERFRAETGG